MGKKCLDIFFKNEKQSADVSMSVNNKLSKDS